MHWKPDVSRKMWSALGNGSGMNSFVSKAHGWEFVAPSGSDRQRSRSPLRGAHAACVKPVPEQPAPDRALHELQSQHSRLRKRFEEQRRRHDHEKDAWMKEKEKLLREMAAVQGGENRRILMELKMVLDEVQSEVKKEESRRTELQLQYTKDRYEWELERAELKCRIAQLEAKSKVTITETSDTLRREREEERRLLADSHTAAMDSHCHREHSRKDWVREKSELLKHFDLERKTWESQLRDMQQKIEELHNEVKAHRAKGDVGPNADTQSSTASSSLSDPAEAHNSYSKPLTQHRHNSTEYSHNSRGLHDQHCCVQGEPLNMRSSGNYESDELDAINSAELEDILHGCLVKGLENQLVSSGQEDLLNPFRIFQSMDINCASDKKKNTIALNAALKEIARASEELCSYQDGFKGKSDKSHTALFPEDVKTNKNNYLETDDLEFNFHECCKELNSLEKQKWINSNNKSPVTECEHTKRSDVPPIPFRSTSWYVNSPSVIEAVPCAPEPLLYKRCRSPCIHRKCNSPSIVRKFEAMLQENEGKILTDSGIMPGPVALDSKCNINCCQSRWSCDGSRFGSSKSSTYMPIQKCLSEANIPTTRTECSPNQMDAGREENLKTELQLIELPHRGVPMESPDLTPHTISTNASRRNETLERKTAEFNRILFQTATGLQCDEDSVSSTHVHHTFSNTTTAPSLCSEEHPRDAVDILALAVDIQHSKAKCSESSTQKPPHLKNPIRNSDLLPQRRGKPEQSLHSVIEKENENSACRPLHTEDRQPSKTSCMKTVQVHLDQSPSKLKHQMDKLSKVKSVTSYQCPVETTLKEHSAEIKCRNMSNARPRVLDESPWKPSTLAAYPRPVESRSNYGAIEKILKSYENLAHSQQERPLQNSPGRGEDLLELLNLLELQTQTRSSQKIKHTPHHQTADHKEACVTEKKVKDSVLIEKSSFARPACPAKRRLPSRWANRSSSTLSTYLPSPTPQVSGSSSRQMFTYSAFHTETVIM